MQEKMYASGQNPFGMVDFTAPQGIRTQRRLMKQTVGGWMSVGASAIATVGNIVALAGLSGIKARTVDKTEEKKEGGEKQKSNEKGKAEAQIAKQGQGPAKPSAAAPAQTAPKKVEGGTKVNITDKEAVKGVEHDKGMTAVDYESRHAVRAITAGAIIAALGGDFTKIRDFFGIHGMTEIKTIDKEGKTDTIKTVGTGMVIRKVSGVVKKEIDELYTEAKITKEGAAEYKDPTKAINANKERALTIAAVASNKRNEAANKKANAEKEKKKFEGEKEIKEKEKRMLEMQIKNKKAELEKADGSKKTVLEREIKELGSKLRATESEIKSIEGKILAADELINEYSNVKNSLDVYIKRCELDLDALKKMDLDSKKTAEQIKSEEYVLASKSFVEYCQVNGYITGNEVTVQDAKRIIRELRDNGKDREANELETRLRPILEPLVTLSNNSYFNERLAAQLNSLAYDAVGKQIALINDHNLSIENFIKKSIGDLVLKKEELDELRKKQPSIPVLETATPNAIMGHFINTNEFAESAKAVLEKGINEAIAHGDYNEANRLRDTLQMLDAKARDAQKAFTMIMSGGIDISSPEAIKPHWEKVVALTQTATGIVAELRYGTEKQLNENCEKYGVAPQPALIQESKDFAMKQREATAKITDDEIRKLLPPESFAPPKEVPDPYKAPNRKALLETVAPIADATSQHIDRVLSDLIPDTMVKEQMKLDQKSAPLSPEEREQYEETLKYNKQVREELIQKKQELMWISEQIQRGAPNVDELVSESIKLTREITSKYPMRFKNDAEQHRFEQSLANAEAAAQKTAEEQQFIEGIKKIMGDYLPGDSVYQKYYRQEEDITLKYAGLQRPPQGK